ncbi:hypothetical protein ACFE04_012233 [Oxalis oulophora]
MLMLCGFGYWVQGFRCFPWLALNFHLAHALKVYPSTLQLVQNFGTLPMVAKPLFGILSDSLCIGGARRIPYISIGAFYLVGNACRKVLPIAMQVLSWGSLALIPTAREGLPMLMACVLLSNLGAGMTEVAKDALVAEYGQKHKLPGLQSFAFMGLAAGAILGNLLGGYILQKMPSKSMFLIFASLLSLQTTLSLTSKEESLGLPSGRQIDNRTFIEGIKKQISDLLTAIKEESIYRPLAWIVGSIAIVPLLSGSIFCYQTQCLYLDPSVIGMSRVISQLMLLSMTVLYDRHWKNVPVRNLIGTVQIIYALSFLLDFILVRQINLKVKIPNDVFALCFSGLAETLAQFKILPFLVLLASLCPHGCEGSLMSFLASALCLSSIISGFLGVGLASLLGITPGDYSNLPAAILVQFLVALLPLWWIHNVPMSRSIVGREKKKGLSKRTRKSRRVGRVVFSRSIMYRPEREPETRR